MPDFSEASHLSVILDHIPAAISLCSSDLRYLWISRPYAAWLGRSPEEVAGRPIRDIIGAQAFEAVRPYIEEVLAGQRVAYTVRVDLAGRGERWMHAVHVPVTSPDGEPGWISMINDATERHRMERETSDLAALVESSEDAIVSKRLDGTILSWNTAAERVYGYTAQEAIGAKMLIMAPSDRLKEEIDILARIQAGEQVTHFETTRVRKGGEPIELSLTISPIRDAEGNVIGVSHIARDITERKNVEKQLQQTQRLESLGVLAGGIAHDFNNLLTGILGNTSLALEGLSTSHPARTPLRNAVAASERAAELTKQLLAYAGKGRFLIEPINLSALIKEISELIQTSIPKTVQLRLDLKQELPLIEADASQIQQLIMNLVINGAEAIGDEASGTVLVTTGMQDVDEVYIRTTFGEPIEPGRYVYLEVHDTGSGMDEGTVARIFDPFFTTKFTGRGLGLAAVHGIVRGHKGGIKVYSQTGRGTTFKVLLPATQKHRAESARQPAVEALTGDATVLVIDDEQIVRQTAKAMLERYGYTVVVAENGKEGLDVFRVAGEKIALVILDMTMPVMSGEETLRNLKLIQPDVKVLLSSGFNEAEAIRRFTGKGLLGFVQKPYSAVQLARRVRGALQG